MSKNEGKKAAAQGNNYQDEVSNLRVEAGVGGAMANDETDGTIIIPGNASSEIQATNGVLSAIDKVGVLPYQSVF